ncbi:MAG: radical SAM protein [Desulfobacteraceae bacterium]|nr:radical SAM protein [Desulfobacteraceae bacterium]
MQLDICEIFYSLQGESTFTGLPCIFIRLSGCNLSCSWCDTRYAEKESQSMNFDQIFKKVASYNCDLVEVTGGEPLLQDDTPDLISMLLEKKYQVLLETNGSKSIKNIHPECIKIIDIKCPSSNESESFLSENINSLTKHDEIKFVIGSRKDYKFAKSIIENKLLKISQKRIHLSPVFGHITPETIASWIIDDNLHARLSLQQHKIIWDPAKRGV